MDRVRALWHRARARPGLVRDVALAAWLGAFQASAPAWLADEPGYGLPTESSVTTTVMGALAGVPLVARRARPILVLALVTAAGLVQFAAGALVPPVTLVAAAYTVGAYSRRRDGLLAMAGVVAAVGVVLWFADRWESGNVLVVLAAAWIMGDRQRTHRAYLAEVEERAAALEREREDRDRLAVADERARIARELHDVVAHSVSVMVVHAGAARRNLARHPERAEHAIREVEHTGRQSLEELRRLLGLLRDEVGQGELAPQPHLDELGDLVAQFRDAGLPVRLEVAGDPRPLPSGVDLSVYRIVQEALTNALKHAQASRVLVRLRYGPDQVSAVVEDDGRGAPEAALSGTGGHGLVGMRERAALLGGRLACGSRPEGGFAVTLELPA